MRKVVAGVRHYASRRHQRAAMRLSNSDPTVLRDERLVAARERMEGHGNNLIHATDMTRHLWRRGEEERNPNLRIRRKAEERRLAGSPGR